MINAKRTLFAAGFVVVSVVGGFAVAIVGPRTAHAPVLVPSTPPAPPTWDGPPCASRHRGNCRGRQDAGP